MAKSEKIPTSPEAPAASPEAQKTTVKTAVKEAAPSTGLIKQAHGGALKPGGTKGNRGGTGRPPDKLKEKYLALLLRPTTQRSLGKILKDDDHKHFAKVFKELQDRVTGRPGVQVRIPGEAGETVIDISGVE